MIKSDKKLRLNKESVRVLVPSEMEQVVGGHAKHTHACHTKDHCESSVMPTSTASGDCATWGK